MLTMSRMGGLTGVSGCVGYGCGGSLRRACRRRQAAASGDSGSGVEEGMTVSRVDGGSPGVKSWMWAMGLRASGTVGFVKGFMTGTLNRGGSGFWSAMVADFDDIFGRCRWDVCEEVEMEDGKRRCEERTGDHNIGYHNSRGNIASQTIPYWDIFDILSTGLTKSDSAG